MKIGIFSDIHGNKYAFHEIWKALKKEACDRYFYLGDICGYYYDQIEIIEMLKNIENLICIRGNHDQLFLNMITDTALEKTYAKKYGSSCRFLKAQISKEHIVFLQSLPDHYYDREYNMGLFHGSPWNFLDEYVYPTDSIDRFKNLPYTYVFMGHTHYYMSKNINNKHIINPGSCGQPRDTHTASFVIFDLKKNKHTLHRIAYNTESLIRDVRAREPHNTYLESVLNRGVH